MKKRKTKKLLGNFSRLERERQRNRIERLEKINFEKKKCAIITESSYPGGGGEEFMYDLSIFLYHKNIEVYWFTFHEWGKSIHGSQNVVERKEKYYTEIQIPNRKICDLSNFYYLKDLLFSYKIDYIVHQGAGHKLVCDLGNILNIPCITFWCFWEEAIEINYQYGLVNINKNLKHHKKSQNFFYIIENIDYFYFASSFVKEIIESKYLIKLSDDHVFITLSENNRSKKDESIDSFNSKYISLLDVHTLKGGKLFAELIEKNPDLNFLGIKTENENEGPLAIKAAMKKAKNPDNILLEKRVNNIKEIYNKTQILLCPTYLDETFCRVVFEAFSNKIPVIFSNKGNLKSLDNLNLLVVDDFDVDTYTSHIRKLINDSDYYNQIVENQYKYFIDIKKNFNLTKILDKLFEIERKKNKNIGIFTPWCDQGLGIQSRIYKHILEDFGFNIFIFGTKPYIDTNKNFLRNDEAEWEDTRVYNSPNKRLEINNLELDLFVKNYKIKYMIIPEIQYQKIFDIASYLKNKYRILTLAIPNVECIRDYEIKQFGVFEKVLTNNKMTFDILSRYGLSNLHHLGFHYTNTNRIKLDPININKKVDNKIKILHLTGLNGLFRKRTDMIIDIFQKIYDEGIENFELNIIVQGNFDINKFNDFNKPFINVVFDHLSYSNILNLYNENHISIHLSKQEGLGLGLYESCFMNTPVITLNASPYNEIIHNNKNGWLLSCYLKKNDKPENPYTIIDQVQINVEIIKAEIKEILTNKSNINEVIQNTKNYLEKTHSIDLFKNNFNKIICDKII